MEIKSELENELKCLQKTRKIIFRNPVFTNEEVNEIEKKIKQLEIILSVLKE